VNDGGRINPPKRREDNSSQKREEYKLSEVILKLEGLTKKYDNKPVVDHINLEIKKGEIFGLLGPNGAGKSTTMNMVCSLVKPTAGKVELFGYDTKTDMKKVKAKLGYIPQELAIHGNLKAWENVELFTSLYGIKGELLKKAVKESLEFVGLEDKRNGFAKTFSGGMKRRLNIACAIGHKPELLVFDEPTVGIDPQSRNFILQKIKFINRQGSTVIYSSHYMEEIEAICTRIAIMDNGKIVAIGTKQELVEMVTSDKNSHMTLEEVFLTLTGKKLRDYAEGEN
jgi:ABC-2 type transport system ATP-binding protein